MNQPVTWGPPHGERADAARNRRHLLVTAREMLAEQGADKLTMDGLAERAGLGKGTVFRRFGSRAGIFQALLDDDEQDFQQQVLAGPPPLGPGASPLDRLIAYGRARIDFLIRHREIARAALDGRERVPAGSQTPMSREHIRFLLEEVGLGAADLDVLATQLTAALDGPLLLYLSSATLNQAAPQVSQRLSRGWEDLIHRVCRSLAVRCWALPAVNGLRRPGLLASLPLAWGLSVVSAEGRCEGVRRGVTGAAGDLGEGQLAGPQVVAGEGHPPVGQVLHGRLAE
jgi:AcrR family transcriptional regulator